MINGKIIKTGHLELVEQLEMKVMKLSYQLLIKRDHEFKFMILFFYYVLLLTLQLQF
jgi:hypothetical protein